MAQVDVSDPVELSRKVNLSAFDVYATISFEHVRRDLELIAALPRGAWLVFSVPNFGAPDDSKLGELERVCTPGVYNESCDVHWRQFKTQAAIEARYAPVLSIREIKRVAHVGGMVKWVVSAQRR